MSDRPQTPGEVYAFIFFGRREADGTFTLCLDAPTADALPVEIGRGFDAIDQVIGALQNSLTAPAVAEDRVASLEEYIPAVNQTIDGINEANDALTELGDRLAEVERWVAEMKAQGPGNRPPTRPRIPKPGTGGLLPNPSLRQQPAAPPPTAAAPQPPPEPRLPGGLLRQPAVDAPRPTFERGTFRPHTPVVRVNRGPGSEG